MYGLIVIFAIITAGSVLSSFLQGYKTWVDIADYHNQKRQQHSGAPFPRKVLIWFIILSIASLVSGSVTAITTVNTLFPQATPFQATVAATTSTPQPTSSFHTPTATFTPPTMTPQPTPTPSPADATDWGILTGDSITVNKTLSCGDGCPDAVVVKITTIQMNRPSEMTWNLSLSAPSGTKNNGFTEVSFPQFTLSSESTPPYQVNPESITAGDYQAKFPYVPVSNQIYTFAVTVSYHRITGGIVSIEAESVTFNPVTMIFRP